jgi:hypothetical protein
MDEETKAYLEILIREIQDSLKEPHLRVNQVAEDILEILDLWVKPNSLHPERVQISSSSQTSNGCQQILRNSWFTIE